MRDVGRDGPDAILGEAAEWHLRVRNAPEDATVRAVRALAASHGAEVYEVSPCILVLSAS